MKKYICLLLGLSLLGACQKKVLYEHPLSLSAVKNELPATAGRTQVLVFANEAWQAFLPSDCDWATIEQTSGNGLGEFIFVWTENPGVVRRTTVTVVADGSKSKIEMVQQSGAGAPDIKFPYSSVRVARCGGRAVIPFTTNIPDTEMAKVRLTVAGASGAPIDWVTDETLYAGVLTFTLQNNDGGETRSAIFTVDYTDGTGVNVTRKVTVQQSLSAPSLSFDAGAASTKYSSRPSTVKLPFSTNLSLFIPDLLSGAGSDKEWAAIRHNGGTDAELVVDLAANNASLERMATLRLAYTDPAGQSYAFGCYLVQKSYVPPVSIGQLKALIPSEEGTAVYAGEGMIEAVVIGDCTNANMEINPLTGAGVRDFTMNGRTNYLTALDGSDGLRVVFDEKEDHQLRRGERVFVDLQGLTLRKESQPARYTLEGLTTASVSVSPEPGSVVVRERRLSELTDADIYTCVKLKDLEFTFKHGAYTNAHDGYQRQLRLPSWPNARGEALNYGGSGSGYQLEDCTPCSLRDAAGDDIYALINNEVPWRRYGNGVPQTACDVTGILTHSTLPGWAWKGDLGRYQLRILEEEDIEPASAAFSRTVIEWNWGRGASDLTREAAAVPTWPSAPAFSSMTSNLDAVDKVVFNGTGTVDYNNLTNAVTDVDADSKGLVAGGCISWGKSSGVYWASDDTADMEAAPWFCFGFSTAGLSGTNLVFNWTAAQGTARGSANNIYAPSVWKVEYSTDGTRFTALDKTYAIHPVVWYKSDCALSAVDGLHMYTTKLPASLLGQDRVYVRIRAAAARTMTSDFSSEDGGSLRSSDNRVRFGEISVQYN